MAALALLKSKRGINPVCSMDLLCSGPKGGSNRAKVLFFFLLSFCSAAWNIQFPDSEGVAISDSARPLTSPVLVYLSGVSSF